MEKRILYAARCIEYVEDVRNPIWLGVFTREDDAHTAFIARTQSGVEHSCLDGLHEVLRVTVDEHRPFGWY